MSMESPGTAAFRERQADPLGYLSSRGVTDALILTRWRLGEDGRRIESRWNEAGLMWRGKNETTSIRIRVKGPLTYQERTGQYHQSVSWVLVPLVLVLWVLHHQSWPPVMPFYGDVKGDLGDINNIWPKVTDSPSAYYDASRANEPPSKPAAVPVTVSRIPDADEFFGDGTNG